MNVSAATVVLLASFVVVHLLPGSSAREELAFCCLSGTKEYLTRRTCFHSLRVSSTCQRISTACCLAALQEKRCSDGENEAKKRQKCSLAGPNDVGKQIQYECCECCLLAKDLSVGSHLGHSVSAQCKRTFERCSHPTNKLPNQTSITYVKNGGTHCDTLRCEQLCKEDVKKGAACFCRAGYKLNDDGLTCSDIDECEEIENPCNKLTQICRNTIGSFVCDCKNGYAWNATTHSCVDIDECLLFRDNCLPGQRCINSPGSWKCIRILSCGTGYYLSAESEDCVDIDECALGTHNCLPGYKCRNTHGSFRCDPKICPPAQKIDLKTGQCLRAKEDCKVGFRADADGECHDVNECIEQSDICPTGHRCENTIGSYRCLKPENPCSTGYTTDPATGKCIDINECKTNTHDCGVGQQCVNLDGSYQCQCDSGYSFNRTTKKCEDVDECAEFGGQVCSLHSICENTPGSFKCRCDPGYELAPDGRNCLDIDECATGIAQCKQRCVNVPGSYQCICDRGYTIGADGISCEDIDECALWSSQGTSLCTGKCFNTPGSYSCQCPNGYKLNYDGKTCDDVDECKNGLCSGRDEICVNLLGSYRCHRIECPKNYIRDPRFKNRCNRKMPMCLPNDQKCLDLPISISNNFIALPSNLRFREYGLSALPLFTMKGPQTLTTTVQFELVMKNASWATPSDPARNYTMIHGVRRNLADRHSFLLQKGQDTNSAVVALVEPLFGPQEIQVDLVMHVRHAFLVFGGKAIARLTVHVSEYEQPMPEKR